MSVVLVLDAAHLRSPVLEELEPLWVVLAGRLVSFPPFEVLVVADHVAIVQLNVESAV